MISDVAFFLVFYIIKYRRKVVQQNLANSFPEKTEEERQEIERKFYKHFCDLIFESIKRLTISNEDEIKHCYPDNPELFQKYYDQGKSVLLALGHFGNWELASGTINLVYPQEFYAIYRPLTSMVSDEIVKKIRAKTGTGLISSRTVLRDMIKLKDRCALYAFLSDQLPQRKSAWWYRFLNQDTAFYNGLEKVSKMMDYPIIYITIDKVKRGHYKITPQLITDDPKSLSEGEIMKRYVDILEADIRRKPEFWLWTHKRWKMRPLPEDIIQ